VARKVFFSFHYKPDNWRAAQVRSIGAIEGNAPVSDNAWELVKAGGDPAIKRWIARQLAGKSCAVVLIGSQTASRKWVRYEIIEAWKAGKGVVGIYIHKLNNLDGKQAIRGPNPFDRITFGNQKFSRIVKAYSPAGATSKEAYAWIRKHLANALAEAIQIRNKY